MFVPKKFISVDYPVDDDEDEGDEYTINGDDSSTWL